MAEGITCFERDFSCDVPIDGIESAELDSYIHRLLEEHFQTATYIANPQSIKQYRDILESACRLARDCRGTIQSRLCSIPLSCEVRIVASSIEYDQYSPELKFILERCNGLSISVDSTGLYVVISIDIPIFLRI